MCLILNTEILSAIFPKAQGKLVFNLLRGADDVRENAGPRQIPKVPSGRCQRRFGLGRPNATMAPTTKTHAGNMAKPGMASMISPNSSGQRHPKTTNKQMAVPMSKASWMGKTSWNQMERASEIAAIRKAKTTFFRLNHVGSGEVSWEALADFISSGGRTSGTTVDGGRFGGCEFTVKNLHPLVCHVRWNLSNKLHSLKKYRAPFGALCLLFKIIEKILCLRCGSRCLLFTACRLRSRTRCCRFLSAHLGPTFTSCGCDALFGCLGHLTTTALFAD